MNEVNRYVYGEAGYPVMGGNSFTNVRAANAKHCGLCVFLVSVVTKDFNGIRKYVSPMSLI